MVTTVSLQPPFEYYRWLLIIAGVMMAGAIALLSMLLRGYLYKRKNQKADNGLVIKVPSRRDMLTIKGDYSARIAQLLETYKKGEVSKRDAYQILSRLIRGFVYESTGITVTNYTKEEIASLGMKKLDSLMNEYYLPEFAEAERATKRSFNAACKRTLEVVRSWK